ncbi:MAG TPA: hypothetical protein VHP36_03340 [Chitinispirillaceae bacterium]|nr:hypothetical protein [Chitinispirillaceae bacterium]
MKIFIIVMIFLGVFEIISNLFHISKKTVTDIGKSGKKQHQELDLKLSDTHFFYKVIIMFIFGILLSITSLLALLNVWVISLFFILILFGLYGIFQAIFYRKSIKAWSAMIVYNIPLIIYIFLIH